MNNVMQQTMRQNNQTKTQRLKETKLPVGWEGGKITVLKSANLGTCLKSKAEMWLTNGMRGLHKVRQVRIM